MKTICMIAIAGCLAVIAANMTMANYYKFRDDSATNVKQASTKEDVLEVVGKYCAPYDGIGVVTGFLVKDGSSYQLVHYDEDSRFAKADAPKFLLRLTWRDGKKGASYMPLSVQ